MATKTQTPQPCRNIEFQLNANTFVRTGYNLIGWNTNWNATTVQYRDMARVTFSDDTDLYGIWSPNGYTVHRSDGYSGSLSDISATFDTPFSVSALSRTGYEFMGWCVESGLNTTTAKYGTSISSCNNSITSSSMLCANGSPSDSVSFKNLTALNDGQVTIAARWVAIQCTVTFNKQGGWGGSSSETATYGQALPVIAIPTRTGYTFDGYYTSTNGQGTQYYDSSSFGTRNSDFVDDVILYAKWSPNYITITFDSND